MSVIDEILEILKDGKWHDLNQVMEKSRLDKLRAEAVTGFLAEYNFVQLDKERRRARLTPPALNFLQRIQRIEEGGE